MSAVSVNSLQRRLFPTPCRCCRPLFGAASCTASRRAQPCKSGSRSCSSESLCFRQALHRTSGKPSVRPSSRSLRAVPQHQRGGTAPKSLSVSGFILLALLPVPTGFAVVHIFLRCGPRPNPTVDPVRFALWTLRDEAAQRRSPTR